MHYAIITKILTLVLKVELCFLAIPTGLALYYGESVRPFIITAIFIVASTAVLSQFKPKSNIIRLKEGFAATALTWIVLSVFGCLPFYFSGYFGGFVNAFFEAVSGFTTTGASILTEIESLPKSILFWRSFTHWLGGMGIIIFVLAFMPNIDSSSVNLLRAESPGPEPGKIVPKIKETAKISYFIYLSLTIIMIVILKLLGLPLFDSFINAMGSAGTGGFSCLNSSIGGYNNVGVEIVVTIFTFLFGVNFTLYFYLLRKDFKSIFKDEELRLYFAVVIIAIVLVTINIYNIYGSLAQALRHSSFQVVTIITTTGFSSTNFDLWPWFSKSIIVFLMLTGCCAGSTGGGLKLVRVLELFKSAKNEVYKIIHPRVVRTVKVNNRRISDEVIHRSYIVFFMYFLILVVATILVTIEGNDLVTASTAIISSLSNIGPGLAGVGPTSNFNHFSSFSKLICSFCMLAGRLEFLPLMVLFSPSCWAKRN